MSAPKDGKAASNNLFGDDGLPTKEAILQALEDHSDIGSKRDLTRYFNLKGETKVAFKKRLRELEGEGLIARRRKQLRKTAALPSVAVLDIDPQSDPDHLLAQPARWDEREGNPPVVLIRTRKGDRVVPGPGDRILARIEKQPGATPGYLGHAIKVLGLPRKATIGIIRRDVDGARLIPVERKQKEMRIRPGDLGKAEDGDLVEVDVQMRGRLMIPEAKVVAVLGNPRSEGAISLIALHNLEIPYRFPAAVTRAAEQLPEVSGQGREDWRDIPFVTIDPDTAKDHDDAVYAEPDEDPKNEGGHVVYVAIADVAAYVRPDTELNDEAFERGNSVYFPDRVVPMLPERISNDLCSLREGENRPSIAVRMVFDAGGHKKSHSFHRVTIRSAARLTYSEAQAAADGNPNDKTGPLLERVLQPLFDAYASMAKARDKRGPLALDLPERRIILNDQGMVSRVYVPERLEAHRLIEEMMIAANVCAAETLEQKQSPLVYRVHDAPGREKLGALRDFLNSLDLSLINSEAVRPSHFNQVLLKAAGTPHTHQVSEMVLRTQARAEYATENLGHFGLNLDRYAHFTSPIRRYADLMVHRALIRALKLGDDGLTDAEISRLDAISEHISFTERRAMAAERETQDRLIAHFLAGRIGTHFEGRISGVTKSGLFVRLNDTGADGFVPAGSLGHDYYHFSEATQALIGERSGETYRLGDAVEVRLLEAAPLAGALRFEIVSEGAFTPASRRTPARGRRGPSKRPIQRRGKRR
ncbi:MAG: ribonuclease R [Hyphomicrobiaceae bacterium]|nr:ribonuclease R [Hyphomicrobiaceae bacterium]